MRTWYRPLRRREQLPNLVGRVCARSCPNARDFDGDSRASQTPGALQFPRSNFLVIEPHVGNNASPFCGRSAASARGGTRVDTPRIVHLGVEMRARLTAVAATVLAHDPLEEETPNKSAQGGGLSRHMRCSGCCRRCRECRGPFDGPRWREPDCKLLGSSDLRSSVALLPWEVFA